MELDQNSSIAELVRLTEVQKGALKKLRIATIRDLLYHIPHRYESAADIRTVAQAHAGGETVIYGELKNLELKKSWVRKVPMAEATLTDGTGSIKVMWFHQPYLAKMLPQETLVRVRGTVSASKGKKYIANPVVEKADSIPILDSTTSLMPVYPESAGITSLWFYHALKRVFEQNILVDDLIPDSVLKKYHLPTLATAFVWAHQPRSEKDADAARKRFAFEEVFMIQLARGIERAANKSLRALPIDAREERVAEFMKTFPFVPTGGQRGAIADILANFLEPYPMARLLEGDVGSGKTAVAAATAYAVVTSRPLKPVAGLGEHSASQSALAVRQDFGNLQVAYMCPTEILAQQHFKTFTEFFKDPACRQAGPIQIGLITSSGCYKFPSKVDPSVPTPISRTQLLKWVANGEIPILIGTHALIQKAVAFKHLAFVIVDEQHRFGTMQRHALSVKGATQPHLLSMTATPIPRTLALTLYGDLDLTVLDELPAGRKLIKTEIVPPAKRAGVYESVKKIIAEGRQAYVICPRIEEPDPKKQMALQSRSVAAEMKSLQKIFAGLTLAPLHSKMSPAEKADTMRSFELGQIHILVATSVVEVGVNVPNATVILIEGSERFGLAQLHQLRGRVQRSSHQAYCYLMVDKSSSAENARLKALASAKNGFELAERDLELRGAGELYGRNQSGLSDIGMDALKNLKLVEAARTEAFALVDSDPSLKEHQELKERALALARALHFE